MSLLGFLTGAASLFGSSGSTTKQSQSSSSTSSTVSDSNTEQAATANESKTATSNQNTSAAGTQSTTGSGATQATGSEATQTAGTTTNYSSDILASLDSLLTQQLAAGGVQTASDAVGGRLAQIQAAAAQGDFDVQGFVSGITQQAASATQSDLDSKINSILSATGSSEGGNSMSALLGAKLRNEAAANLAGITANARATGEQIRQGGQESLTSQISGLSADATTQLSALLAAAKGGTQTTTGSANTASTQASTTQNAQQTQEQQTQQTQQTDTSNTQQTGITQTQQSGTSTTKNKTTAKGKSNTDKGLFDKILGAFNSSSAAA